MQVNNEPALDVLDFLEPAHFYESVHARIFEAAAGRIADTLISLSAGHSSVVALVLLMFITMTLSDVMNNTATAVITAPIAIQVAGAQGSAPILSSWPSPSPPPAHS